jgi:hypothetical protein
VKPLLFLPDQDEPNRLSMIHRGKVRNEKEIKNEVEGKKVVFYSSLINVKGIACEHMGDALLIVCMSPEQIECRGSACFSGQSLPPFSPFSLRLIFHNEPSTMLFRKGGALEVSREDRFCP